MKSKRGIRGVLALAASILILSTAGCGMTERIQDMAGRLFGGEEGQEKATAGLTVADSDIAFTIRFCKRAAEVTADGFRILFQGEIYNIAAVDHMNYKKKALKFRCEKARR